MNRNYQKYKNSLRTMGVQFVLLLILSSLLACSKQEIVEENYMVKVDDVIIAEAELMVYAYQVYEEFLNIGGENVWEFEDFSGGKSAVEVAGEAVLKNIVRIKIIQKKADEFKIELSDEQKETSQSQALDYYRHLPEAFKQEHGITEETVNKVFVEFVRAKNVYTDLTSDLNPDEEAIQQRMLEESEYEQLLEMNPEELLTQTQFQRIFIAFDEANNATEVMNKVREEAINGEDFDSLIDEYNQGEEISITYTKAFIPEQFKKELIQLEEGEVSQVIINDVGAFLFKNIDIIEPTKKELEAYKEKFSEYEKTLRQKAIEKLKSEHFDVVYEEWRRNISVEINREQWGKVDFDFE